MVTVRVGFGSAMCIANSSMSVHMASHVYSTVHV